MTRCSLVNCDIYFKLQTVSRLNDHWKTQSVDESHSNCVAAQVIMMKDRKPDLVKYKTSVSAIWFTLIFLVNLFARALFFCMLKSDSECWPFQIHPAAVCSFCFANYLLMLKKNQTWTCGFDPAFVCVRWNGNCFLWQRAGKTCCKLGSVILWNYYSWVCTIRTHTYTHTHTLMPVKCSKYVLSLLNWQYQETNLMGTFFVFFLHGVKLNTRQRHDRLLLQLTPCKQPYNTITYADIITWMHVSLAKLEEMGMKGVIEMESRGECLTFSTMSDCPVSPTAMTYCLFLHIPSFFFQLHFSTCLLSFPLPQP